MTGGLPHSYHRESGDVLDAVLSNSRDSILLLTVGGSIEYASGGAAALLGCPKLEKALGTPWLDYWPVEARDSVRQAVDAAGEGRRVEFTAATRSGGEEGCWWDVAISPVRDSSDAITHLLAVATDVTGRRRVVRDERRRREEAERNASRAGDVAREMRHRLKNQLAVIGAVAKLLARHTHDAKDLAKKLEDKLISLARAQDILFFAGDDTFSAEKAVKEVLNASGAGDQVTVADIPEVPLPQEAVQQIALILGELQTNALKYGALSQGGGRIELSGRMTDGVLQLIWREHCAGIIAPSGAENGGILLVKRLGSAGQSRPDITWHEDGIQVTFYVRTEN
ncbi:sensor histidine kinase [Qipengyuania sp.]|uniref:sensor histidine kinase n=1 Tax=Qipengyuania sp. TaxID=2004515 RepID=UPI0035C85086